VPLPEAWSRGVDALVADRERGASLLALDALALLEQAAAEAPRGKAGLAQVSDLARALRAARPSMPAIANLVNLAMHEAAGAEEAGVALARAERAAAGAQAQALEARGGAARAAAALARGTVLTHSASETVTKALRAAKRAGTLARVVVAEGRPGFEGRELARGLAEEGVEVLLVVDAALGLHAREADVALVGADAILAEGALVNKVGTRLLAFACERAGTPLYGVADRFKISPASAIPLEEKAPAEVWPDAPRGVQVRNIYFDRTEAALVRGYATDAGLLSPSDVGGLAREHATWADWEARLRRLVR
jgi:translation initiation factor 2B subunit (eIF-2B alpha/beta/delta family)